MSEHKNLRDRNAKYYDKFIQCKDTAAYEKMYELLRTVVRQKLC